MNKSFPFFLIITIFFSRCFSDTKTFNEENAISQLGTPQKITFFKHINGQAFQFEDVPTFTIKNKNEIKTALVEIANANKPEPYKGAGWDKIVLTYHDTIISLKTDKHLIGLHASGTFYQLSKNNFIKRKLNMIK